MPSLDQSKFTPEISQKYTLQNNSLVQVAKANPKDKIDVEVGDTKQADFLPQVKIMRWDNEVNFSVRLTDTKTGQDKISTATDKIIYEKGNKKIEFYDYVDGEGGYKLVWYLLKKPKTNNIEFTIQSKGLNFFYQPPLTQEYQNGYSDKFKKEIVVTETQVEDLEGNVLVNRPIDVVGSYAVYHQTKGGMVDKDGKDYKVGKAFHIYRPHLFDANGRESWGILHIENGIYSVEIPQEFLDTAVYPIKSNDTFGYTGTGGSLESIANYGSGTPYSYRTGYSIPSLSIGNGTLDKITAVVSSNDNTEAIDITVFINQKNSDGTNIHGQIAKVQRTNVPVTNTKTAQDFTASSQNLVAGTTYILNIVGDCYDLGNGDIAYVAYDSGAYGSNVDHYSEDFSGASQYTNAQEDPWTETASTSAFWGPYSIYATYTAEGGGGTNMQLNIGDTWKVVASAKINIGDTWKDVTAAKVNIGDTWKTIF